MKNCSIIRYAWFLVGVLAVAMAIMATANQFTTREVRQATRSLAEHNDPFQRKALELKLDVIQVQQFLSDISATRGQNGLDDGLDNAAKHAAEAHKLIGELEALDEGNGEFYTRLRESFDAYYQSGRKMAQLYVDQGPAGGNAFMPNFDAAAEKIGTQVNGLLKRAADAKQAVFAKLRRSQQTATVATMVTSLLLAVIIIGGLMMLIRTIRPLGGLTEVALQMADNDFTRAPPQIAGGNEIGRLAEAMSRMQTQLRASIGEIAASSGEVGSAVDAMNGIAETTSQSIGRQQSEIEQVATAINEMVATVQEISRNTSAAAEAAHHSDQEVDRGQRVVEETVNAINRLADEVMRGTEVIGRLEEESENIGAVLDVIKGIAEQTNLLALNAAIEAARAGEQGRGFAVVADEVRTLASRTAQSTQEIQQMIERLQQGAREAVAVMEQGRSTAQTTVEHAGEAGRSLTDIRNAVSTISDMSTQIASAAEEQSAVSEEINRNIVAINQAVEATADTAQQASNTGSRLAHEADQLQGVVQRFRI